MVEVCFWTQGGIHLLVWCIMAMVSTIHLIISTAEWYVFDAVKFNPTITKTIDPLADNASEVYNVAVAGAL